MNATRHMSKRLLTGLLAFFVAMALAVGVAGCGGLGYWDQSGEYGDRPMYDLKGDGVKGHISAALHEDLVKKGVADKEDELIGKITRDSLNSTFFLADIPEGGVDPAKLREGNVPGWDFGTPKPIRPEQTKVEVSCRKVSSVPEWLRR